MDYVPFLIFVLLISAFSVLVNSYEFQVGGHKGWTKPSANDTQTYNHWATQNRFQVGDSLHFKYENDSVLIVKATAYEKCDVWSSIATYDDGDTKLKIERDGLFYFISGNIEHCEAGQKMVIRVLVQPGGVGLLEDNGSTSSNDGWDDDDDGAINWGPHPLNSTLASSLASSFLTALGGVLAILYLLM